MRSGDKDADLKCPVASYAEQDGSFTNHAGRVQRITRAFPTRGDAKPAGAIVRELIRRAGGAAPPETAAATFALLAQRVPLFAGLTWKGMSPAKPSGTAMSAIISLEGAQPRPEWVAARERQPGVSEREVEGVTQ